MPVKPCYLEPKKLQRSKENESVFEKDQYPESSVFKHSQRFISDSDEISPGHQTKMPTSKQNEFPNSKQLSKFQTKDITAGLYADICRDELVEGFRNSGHSKQLSRVIEKNGSENVTFRRVPEKSWRYIRDFVTTLIELEWKFMLTIFVGSYFCSWLFFAVLWYTIAFSHGDLFFDEVTGERLGEGKEPCIIGVHNFLSILIYSIETQTTIGFGEKYPSEECPESVFLFIMQIIVSIAIEGGMISIIYAKTARPVQKMTKLKFSNKAVICYREEKLCLIFRVCDPREQQTIDSQIHVYMIVDRLTREGEVIKTRTELKLEGNGRQMFVWPETVCHVIDEHSPLRYYSNAKEFNAAHFELYISIVGVSPTTAQYTEARTSYLPREIFWGQRFTNIINYDILNKRYVVDNENFNTTISVDMHPHVADLGNMKLNKTNRALEN